MSSTTTTTTTSGPLYLSTSQSKTAATPSSPLVASQFKSKKMSLTQTYFLAHKARGKLSHEAARPDHNLRLLVGHANLLDSLMLDLADAEREQESWFNHSVRGATPKSEEKHIQWADTVIEEPEEDWRVEDADSDSDSSDSDSDLDDDEDIEMADAMSLRRMPAKSVVPTLLKTDSQYDDMEEDDDEEEDYAQLTLTRTHSHSASPPELDHDSDSSEDESMPPSPPTAVLPTFSEKQRESISSAAYYDSRQEQEDKDAFYDEGFYLPARNPARLVSAISVY
ncbi:hypothetical protein BR93DRAFT_924561 [Coniochaeta sp. PMI_546]|nr:hypothetical protein BR93DRAFT_924561 [Coniochaeta sp. PMI_546]